MGTAGERLARRAVAGVIWLAAAAAAQAQTGPERYAAPWYWTAVNCAAAAAVERDALPEGDTARGALTEELLAWGLVAAEAGPQAGRSAEQVDRLDLKAAEEFARLSHEHRAAAFRAHRAYCREMRP